MNWYIGQPIVAIRDHSTGAFKKGAEFIIKGLKQGKCTDCSVMIDVGIIGHCKNSICLNCNNISLGDYSWWFNYTNFAPLDVNISELTEILKNSEPVYAPR